MLLDETSFGLTPILVRKILDPLLKSHELIYLNDDSDVKMMFLSSQLVETATEIHEHLSMMETYHFTGRLRSFGKMT